MNGKAIQKAKTTKEPYRVKRTPYHSYCKGRLAKGCRMCVKGEKLVLFVGGICNRQCFYCPLSDQKRQKDVLFANEWDMGSGGKRLTRRQKEIILEEARLCGARGAGITGGDPLLVNSRTVDAIRHLKKTFGKKFHIHLYTTLENITKQKLAQLSNAGLDEIRIHPVIWNDLLWHRMPLVTQYDWDIGAEIPSIPGREEETKKLVDFLDGKISFLNLNELEISDTNANQLLANGFVPKNRTSYGTLGSETLAKKLLRYVAKKDYHFDVHYCTCTLKDRVQMTERLKRRAKNARLPTDIVTWEGMLKRGAIYMRQLTPGFGYRKKLTQLTPASRRAMLLALEKAQRHLAVLKEPFSVDKSKLRLLTSVNAVVRFAPAIKQRKLVPAVVVEYPTSDAMEVEVDFL